MLFRSRRLDIHPLSDETIAAALGAHGEGGEDLELVAALAEGSLRRAIMLAEGDGVEIYRLLTNLLAGLPDLDIEAAHAFADKVSGRGGDDSWVAFDDMFSAWLNRRVRGEPEPGAAGQPSRPVLETPLERWAEVWETLRNSLGQADEFNLDRKRTVLSILMSLARATRM